MGRVIDIHRGHILPVMQPAVAQVTQGQGHLSRYADNQFTRRSLIRQLLLGAGFRQVGRKHPGGETGLAQDIREAILGGDGGKRAA